MAMLTIVTEPDEVLHRRSEPVATIDRAVQQLCRAMIDTLRQAAGIGLAAPQVGRLSRLFVVRLPDEKPRLFINPQIQAVSDRQELYEEGCLSIPGVYANVRRPVGVQVEAFDQRGKRFALEAEGMLARVIQHEYDHLEGVLFWERVVRRQREGLQREYAQLRREERPQQEEQLRREERPQQEEQPRQEARGDSPG